MHAQNFQRLTDGCAYPTKSAALHNCTILVAGLFTLLTLALTGCAGVNTFPSIARPGDTVSVMIGGSEQASKDTISAVLTDSYGTNWDLKALGKIRSVFNLRPDGRAAGLHYSPWLDTENSWLRGHEPIQTVLVFDVPNSGIAYGPATLQVNPNTPDDASGVPQPYTISMNIVDVPGSPGASDSFLRQLFATDPAPANFQDLEPAPYAKISFGDGSVSTGHQVLYAASLVVNFDNSILNGDDINVYAPESTVRGSFSNPGAGSFGQTQHMVYWHHDATHVYIDIIAPQGVEGRYLQIYMVHPRNLSGDPAIQLTSTTAYDANGNVTTFTPTLAYFP